jgi:hypothetical protein
MATGKLSARRVSGRNLGMTSERVLLAMKPEEVMNAYDAAKDRGDTLEVQRIREFIEDRLYQANFC